MRHLETRLSRSVLAALAVGAWLSLSAAPAQAAPIPVPPGGFTLIEVTSFPVLLSLDPTIVPPGEAGALFGQIFARFPVTALDLGAGVIEHAGGLQLTDGVAVVSLTDFVIDTGAGKVFANLNGGGPSSLALFDLVPCTALGVCPVGPASSILTGIGLNFTDAARGALAQAFGVQIPAGFQFGIVKQVTVVPEPSAALLLSSGLAGLAWLGSPRRRAAAR